MALREALVLPTLLRSESVSNFTRGEEGRARTRVGPLVFRRTSNPEYLQIQRQQFIEA